jgi:hypothetical protein
MPDESTRGNIIFQGIIQGIIQGKMRTSFKYRRRLLMTVASQLKQTLSTLNGARATIEKFAAYHPDPHTKLQFVKAAKEIKIIIEDLETRIGQVEFEEPQFKGF